MCGRVSHSRAAIGRGSLDSSPCFGQLEVSWGIDGVADPTVATLPPGSLK